MIHKHYHEISLSTQTSHVRSVWHEKCQETLRQFQSMETIDRPYNSRD